VDTSTGLSFASAGPLALTYRKTPNTTWRPAATPYNKLQDRPMGGARNLKLGATWQQRPGHRGQYFCAGQLSTLFSCMHQKNIVWFRRRAPSWEVKGKAPPKAENTCSFWIFNGSRKCTCVFITESLYCTCCPAKTDV